MRGVLAPAPDGWVDLVAREASERCALPRPGSLRPALDGPGDAWFIHDAASRGVVAVATFVEHDLLSPREAFDALGYATGALSVEAICAGLDLRDDDDPIGWVYLEDLRSLRRAWGERELDALGLAAPVGSALVRIDAAQVVAILADAAA